MPGQPPEPLFEAREARDARFIFTPEASFFIPGTIGGRTADGRPQRLVLASMRGQLLGRPIITIPPEEGD